jgi:hypothetical protein
VAPKVGYVAVTDEIAKGNREKFIALSAAEPSPE